MLPTSYGKRYYYCISSALSKAQNKVTRDSCRRQDCIQEIIIYSHPSFLMMQYITLPIATQKRTHTHTHRDFRPLPPTSVSKLGVSHRIVSVAILKSTVIISTCSCSSGKKKKMRFSFSVRSAEIICIALHCIQDIVLPLPIHGIFSLRHRLFSRFVLFSFGVASVFCNVLFLSIVS